MTSTTAGRRAAPPAGLTEQARNNIRLLKALRQMSGEAIATAGGYNSRQMVADRLSGRTPITLDDVELFARALRVTPLILLASGAELVAWVEANPGYRPPAQPKARRQ